MELLVPHMPVARIDPRRAVPRTQSSAAVSADGERWFLLNASPDVRDQLRRLSVPTPAAVRHVPVEGIVLTDAELDHTLGIVLLREARRLQVAATDAVRRVLEDDSRLLPVTRAFAEVTVDRAGARSRRSGSATATARRAGSGSTCFPVPAGPPRFAREDRPGHTVGLVIQDERYRRPRAPSCLAAAASTRRCSRRLASADLVLFDGTFWTDDELIRLGIGERTAREMDHLPVSGADGSLARLGTLPARQRVYTHINNTNPMLLEDATRAGPGRASRSPGRRRRHAVHPVTRLMTTTLAASQLATPPRPPIPALERPLSPAELEDALRSFHGSYYVAAPVPPADVRGQAVAAAVPGLGGQPARLPARGAAEGRRDPFQLP